MRLIRTENGVTRTYELLTRKSLPACQLRNGVTLRAVDYVITHEPRKWSFVPTNGYGDPSRACGPGTAEIRE